MFTTDDLKQALGTLAYSTLHNLSREAISLLDDPKQYTPETLDNMALASLTVGPQDQLLIYSGQALPDYMNANPETFAWFFLFVNKNLRSNQVITVALNPVEPSQGNMSAFLTFRPMGETEPTLVAMEGTFSDALVEIKDKLEQMIKQQPDLFQELLPKVEHEFPDGQTSKPPILHASALNTHSDEVNATFLRANKLALKYVYSSLPEYKTIHPAPTQLQ